MSGTTILGAGAFGTALAIALGKTGRVTLWGRDQATMSTMQNTRVAGPRLPHATLPEGVVATSKLSDIAGDVALLAVPMQELARFLETTLPKAETLVACCKGVDLKTGLGPVATVNAKRPDAQVALLTGPSFAADIARHLPTALVLATQSDNAGQTLQDRLARPALRLYRTTDVIGAELGGALKNVVALAAGMAIGAGFGDSARASVIARGFAEMVRYAVASGADAETLQGLSGLGDLVLTCTSEKSRNFRAGCRLGAGQPVGQMTIEGIATAAAVAAKATASGIEMPITQAVAAVTSGQTNVAEVVAALLSRPVNTE